jgi:hypothetical protein
MNWLYTFLTKHKLYDDGVNYGVAVDEIKEASLYPWSTILAAKRKLNSHGWSHGIVSRRFQFGTIKSINSHQVGTKKAHWRWKVHSDGAFRYVS